jgi:pyrrolysine biosynthesis protein PylD
MTRLTRGDIAPILGSLDDYDGQLRRTTGASLRQIACRAADVEEALMMKLSRRVRIAAVPVGSGLGLIDGFSGTVAGIVTHLGFDAFVTESSDVAGLAEGIERGAHILMLADDVRFVAIAPERGHVVDNNLATAQGFVAALELMHGSLTGRSALVLGCGPVGVAAATSLLDHGADVALCDIRHERVAAALRKVAGGASDRIRGPDRIRMEEDARAALRRYELIFDATDAGGFIEPSHLGPKTVVAAVGLPCALTPEAMAEHRERILHDALEIGTATMAIQAAATLAGKVEEEKADES